MELSTFLDTFESQKEKRKEREVTYGEQLQDCYSFDSGQIPTNIVTDHFLRKRLMRNSTGTNATHIFMTYRLG